MTVTKRYFIDNHGVPTTRMQGKPGMSHYEIAKLLDARVANDDFYDQMFAMKYVRAAEDATTNTLWIDSNNKPLTNGQRRYVRDMQADGWTVFINHREFLESRDPSAAVRQVLAC